MTAITEETNTYTPRRLFSRLDTLCSSSCYCIGGGGKKADLLFSWGERKVGFPFSNFYLPSLSAATICLQVNLPIIVPWWKSMCVSSTACCPCILATVTHRQGPSEAPVDTKHKETKPPCATACALSGIDCVFVCVKWSVSTDIPFTVCVFSYCVCMHTW